MSAAIKIHSEGKRALNIFPEANVYLTNDRLTPYLTERPTIDRYVETVERIAEDFHSRAMPRTGPRRAIAQIGAPIDVSGFSEMKLREALPTPTEKINLAKDC